MPTSVDPLSSSGSLLKQLSPYPPGTPTDSTCSPLPPDTVRLQGVDAATPMEQYTASIITSAAGTAQQQTLAAGIQQTTPAGQTTTEDLSKLRATAIEVKFRTARTEFPNAQHAYIEITRANGFKQDLAAYPVGGFPRTSEGGQLQFEAGNEKRGDDIKSQEQHATKKAYALTPPPGCSLTDYANSLVDGAKQYNAHAVRYDPIAQQPDRFNSNSFVSSLIVAKGGATGLKDVTKIAKGLDSGPVTTAGQRPSMNDGEMAERVRVDSDHNRLIATGFSNAGIESTRFARSELSAATPPPIWKDFAVPRAGVFPVMEEAAHRAAESIRRLWQH